MAIDWTAFIQFPLNDSLVQKFNFETDYAGCKKRLVFN